MHPAAAQFERQLNTKADLLAEIRVSLGGRGAELVYYGADDGLSTGASGDLKKATHIVQNMMYKYGMEGDLAVSQDAGNGIAHGMNGISIPKLSASGSSGAAAQTPVRKTASEILDEQMDETLKVLNANRKYLDALSAELVAKERLSVDDLKRILPPIGGGVVT